MDKRERLTIWFIRTDTTGCLVGLCMTPLQDGIIEGCL